MRRVGITVAASALGIALGAAPAIAQVPPHDHFLTVPGTGEQVQVAPHRCDLGATVQTGFLNFHQHVHLGTPTSTGNLTITPTFC
jgi:hypothetical protein